MTPAQVRRRMSVRDLIEWQEFSEEFGPLTVQERLDEIAFTLYRAHGGEADWERFRRRWTSPRPIAGDQVAGFFRAIATRQAS